MQHYIAGSCPGMDYWCILGVDFSSWVSDEYIHFVFRLRMLLSCLMSCHVECAIRAIIFVCVCVVHVVQSKTGAQCWLLKQGQGHTWQFVKIRGRWIFPNVLWNGIEIEINYQLQHHMLYCRFRQTSNKHRVYVINKKWKFSVKHTHFPVN